jgi:hypothetical protein
MLLLMVLRASGNGKRSAWIFAIFRIMQKFIDFVFRFDFMNKSLVLAFDMTYSYETYLKWVLVLPDQILQATKSLS